MIYRCPKNVDMDPTTNAVPYTAFTAGKTYEGHQSATPGGEWAIEFVNDQAQPHLIDGPWLREYFELADEGDGDEWEYEPDGE